MHIGSVIVVIWLVIGGIAAGQRGDYKGPMDCSRASTTAVTILAGPLDYAGVNLNINCSVPPQQLAGPKNPRGGFCGPSVRLPA